MKKTRYAEYEAAEPYFALVRSALGDLVDGEHFFDVVADNIVYEVLYDLGWPRQIKGRANLMSQFGGYGGYITLQSADHLITHKADDGRTVVIEYEVHGTVLATGAKYNKPEADRVYHVLAVVQLIGHDREVWLDKSNIYLIPQPKVAAASLNCEQLAEYRFSRDLVQQLFGKLPD